MNTMVQEDILKGDEVVITGMSGIFPKSDSVLQFMENLYNKVDMVIAVDPGFAHPNVPKFLGKLNGLNKFDAQFFKVHFNQAIAIDPACRKLMEHAYSAIYDAGINPLSLNGNKIGVYTGTCYMDCVTETMFGSKPSSNFFLGGTAKTMFANRISYFLNAKGPSYCIDGSTASSVLCLEQAYQSLVSGEIDAAIVAGSNYCKQPTLSVNLNRSGLVCLDGKTKCFDKNGDGSVRAEAISVIFLQKAKDAKRIYCQLYYAKTSYSKPDFHCLSVRQETDISIFLNQVYNEVDVNPSDVEYVEANATGIAINDEQELRAINNFFGKKSKVKVGSVKSNMGNSESASGMCGITKACLAYHTGRIPANINCINSMDCINNVVILKENETFSRGFVAINDFSYTGIDGHILLKGYVKPKNNDRYKSTIPYLINISGRQEECVNQLFDILQSYSFDPEYIGLLHNIYKEEVKGHTARGYIILNKNENKQTYTLNRSVEYYSGSKRQVWFVFSGMGSQWAGMGEDLMQIPIFSESIRKCDKVLKLKGLDIINIVTNNDKTIFDNILNCFVGIAAIQVGLIDILKSVGIECDYMIGHSAGETACAYADGSLTAEEMILSAYSRGLASSEANTIKGAMAAIGLGYKDLCPLCPPEIDIGCHNSNESSTISGPTEAVAEFVTKLEAMGIFARQVPCSNIAFHSRYIASTGKMLRKYLDDVIKQPKIRSKKWLSTSVTEEKWLEPYAKYSSSEYFTNNLTSYVYFEETSKYIPSDAIVIEVAPHGLLQAILKRSHPECLHIPLTRRGHEDQVKFLLEAIGKIYQAGVNVKIDTLYPKIDYPVSTETQFLSHLVKWEHSEDWPASDLSSHSCVTTRNRDVVISVFDDDYASIKGNIRNGNIIFPESALLVLIWETLAMSMSMDYKDLSVIFTNVHFHSQITVDPENILNLSISITKQEGKFEVFYENKIVVSGLINVNENNVMSKLENVCGNIEIDIILNASDIYKFLKLRGHVYENEFQSLYAFNINSKEAYIKWTDDWITFLDGIIQVNTLANNHNGISSPKLIECLSIDVVRHSKNHVIVNGVVCHKADYYKFHSLTRSGGVQLKNIIFKDIIQHQSESDYIGTKQFFSHFPKTEINVNTAISTSLQIVGDAILKKDITVTLLNSPEIGFILNALNDVLNTLTIKIKVNSINDCRNLKQFNGQILSTTDLFTVYDFVMDSKKISDVYEKLQNEGFILILEKRKNEKYIIETDYFNVISSFPINDIYVLALLKKSGVNKKIEDRIVLKIDTCNSFRLTLQNELNHSEKHIVLLFQSQQYFDMTGYIKKLLEKHGNRISLFMMLGSQAPVFDINNNMYSKQLEKHLALNTLYNGEWGGYYYYNCDSWCKLMRNYQLCFKETGNFDSFRWQEIDVPKSKNIVKVKYAGISIEKTENVIGDTVGRDLTFGMDFSGVDYQGNRVMGVISGGAIAKEIECDTDLLWPVPSYWSLEDAATVPLPYTYAYYCLVVRGNIKKRKSVFITGGAGALGQALISICLSLECKVFTTVSDMLQKKILVQLFPKLKETRILCSQHDDFYAFVISQTKNKLCNYVINCENGNLRKAAMKCVARFGCFLDLSNLDMMENKSFSFAFMHGSKHYYSMSLSSIFRPEYSEEKKKLQLILADGIAKGVVKPITHTIFSLMEAPRAFRYFSSRHHVERVILNLQEQFLINVSPSLILNPKHTYLVIGDQGEVCVGLLELLIERGAKKIFLHLRTIAINSFIKAKLQLWKEQNVEVKLNFNKIEDELECSLLFNNAISMGPVEGIFILINKIEKSLSLDDVEDILLSTSSSVVNLSKMSQNIDSIRYFVTIFESLSDKNTLIEDEYMFSMCSKICQYRNDVGLPALLYRAEFVDKFEQLSIYSNQNMRQQTIKEALLSLEKCIKMNYSNAISFNTNKNIKFEYLRKLNEILSTNLVTSNDEFELNTRLDDWLKDEEAVEKIRTIIQEHYKIDVPINKLKQMNLFSIQNIEHDLDKADDNTDASAFFNYVDDDSYAATEPIKQMLTSINNGPEELNEMESIDPDSDYLLLIPGFEGHHRIFKNLCLSLKIKALTLQLGSDLLGDSISEIAENIIKNIPIKIEEKKKFYILGYSFGVNVALEIAAILERKGKVGVVCCLDSSPELVRLKLDTFKGNLTEEELQNVLVDHIYYLVTKNTNKEFSQDLRTLKTFDQKVYTFLNEIQKHSNHPIEYITTTLQSAYKRILLARSYNPAFKLESELILIKGTTNPDAKHLPYDYNLSEYSKRAVKIVDINSNHARAPFDVRVPCIINKMLDAESLKMYKKTNQCFTYFV